MVSTVKIIIEVSVKAVKITSIKLCVNRLMFFICFRFYCKKDNTKIVAINKKGIATDTNQFFVFSFKVFMFFCF